MNADPLAYLLFAFLLSLIIWSGIEEIRSRNKYQNEKREWAPKEAV